MQTSYCLLLNSSCSIDTMRKQSNLWTPCVYFSYTKGYQLNIELYEFNTPHTGTALRHPRNWLCRLRCKIPLRHLATSSLGNIFWRHSCFSPKQPEPQTHDDFNVPLLKQQTRLLPLYGEHISIANSTMPKPNNALFAQAFSS